MKIYKEDVMEFMMSYGWAIIVVLVSVGTLAYFGVFNVETSDPAKNIAADCVTKCMDKCS